MYYSLSNRSSEDELIETKHGISEVILTSDLSLACIKQYIIHNNIYKNSNNIHNDQKICVFIQRKVFL